MNPLPALAVLAAAAGAFAAGGEPLIVSQMGEGRFTGADEKPIQAAVAEAMKQGGGEIMIRPGVYLIEKSILLDKARRVAIRGTGAEEVVLKLKPPACAEVAEAATAGATEIRLRKERGMAPGMVLHVDAAGAVDNVSKQPKPYVLATVQSSGDGRIVLTKPLAQAIPAGTTMREENAPNLIEIRGGSGDILIEKLTLDGGRTDQDPPIRGHAKLCAVFVSGDYTYEKGPTGPQVEDVMINRCIIQNCFGRGVAFYSVKQGFVLNTTIRDTNDEAVDFDHFAVKCAMQACHVARCRVGVELNDANDCLVQNNDFLCCATGLNLWRWCKQEDLNKRNAIRGNLFRDTEENALQLGSGTGENLVEQNIVDGAGRNGLVISGDSQRVVGNAISGAKLKPLAVSGEKHVVEGNRTD